MMYLHCYRQLRMAVVHFPRCLWIVLVLGLIHMIQPIAVARAAPEPAPSGIQLPPVPFQAELDINTMTRAQYAGAVSMAMETMRLVYGEMTPALEKAFEAEWAPLFAHPSVEIIDYLNKLNPMLTRFLAIRDTLNQTIESYQSILFEMSVAVSEEDFPYLQELTLSERVTTGLMNQLNVQLNDVIREILELGDLPDAAELQRRRRQQHEEMMQMLGQLGDDSMLQVRPASLVTAPLRPVTFEARVKQAPVGAKLRWFFHDGRSITTELKQTVKHEFAVKEGQPAQPLKVMLVDGKGRKLAEVVVPIEVKHQEGEWVLVDRQVEQIQATDHVNSARDAGFTGAEGSLKPDKLIYAKQDVKFDECLGTLSFLNPPGSEGWRVNFWWTDPPRRLRPTEVVNVQVKARMDFVGGIRDTWSGDDKPRSPLPNGEIIARLSRIRPWAEKDDLAYGSEGRAKAEVSLGTVTHEQALSDFPVRTPKPELRKVPRPYLAEDFGARRRIDPAGQMLIIDVAGTIDYRIGIRERRLNRFTVRYTYRWAPTGTTLKVWNQDPAKAPKDGTPQIAELTPEQQEQLARRAQIDFHRNNVQYFEENLRRVHQQLRAASDPEHRNSLTRDLLYQQDALQREHDAIASLQTGQFVRTRTELDALNMRMMLEESRRMSEDAATIHRTLERMPRLIAMAPPEERVRLTAFFDRHLRSRPGHEMTAEQSRLVSRIIGNQVVGGLEKDAASADLAAIDAAQRLERAENVKTFCDGYLMVLSTAAPIYHAFTAPNLIAGAMRARKIGQLYTLYQGTTGYVEGGLTKAFTNVASSYNAVTTLANAGMQGYHSGVLKHLEQYAADPTRITLDETSAGLSGAAWTLSTEGLKTYIMKKGMNALMPAQPAGTTRKWPTIEQQVQQAQFQSRQANGRAAVRLFQQRAASLAEAGKSGAPTAQILRLRQSMNEAYIVVKSDYFAKMHVNSLARAGDLKTTHYYNSCERQYTARLTAEVDRRMTAAGYSPQRYRSFSNSSSRGKVGMDLDFGVVEPPRTIMRDGKVIPNPEHIAWRRSITQTLPDGTIVRRSPHELQAAGHETLHAAYEEVFGRPPGEAMIEFTSSYHPEAYRDLAWLGRKGTKTALIFETDPQWVQQATDVTNFKIHHLPRDHPHLTYYGTMQERMRGLVKDFDTKIQPMTAHQSGKIDPLAVQRARNLRNVMHRFAQDEIGPVEAEHQIRELTGGRGMVEVAEQLTILMRELRVNLTPSP